jgi:flagellar assembly protein FliH
MSNIIDKEELSNHQIRKFEFGTFDDQNGDEFGKLDDEFEPFGTFSNSEDEEESIKESKPTQTPTELLEKIDKLTDENVKLQLQLESKEKDFEQRVEQERKKAFDEGREEGLKESSQTLQEEVEELKSRLIQSITNLDESAHKIKEEFENSKDELVDSAIIIAQKVIKKELDQNSSIIAKNIAQSILADLQEATQITIKANPVDVNYLNEHLNSSKIIKIEPDYAVNKGGIIILSNQGNIDGDIRSRLQKAIALLKEEE